jgi:hypothetical protein
MPLLTAGLKELDWTLLLPMVELLRSSDLASDTPTIRPVRFDKKGYSPGQDIPRKEVSTQIKGEEGSSQEY